MDMSKACGSWGLIGLLSGCSGGALDPGIGRAVSPLTIGSELTLLPDLPAASAPVQPLGYSGTATVGGVRATAWAASNAGSVAFWSASAGFIAQASLGNDVREAPAVATDGVRFLVAWQSAAGVVAARFDTSGTRLDVTALVVSASGRAGNRGDTLACLFDGRDFVLAYNLSSTNAVEVARVTTAGAVRDRVNLGALSPIVAARLRLAHASGGYLVAATGQYSTIFPYPQLTYVRLDANLARLDATPRVVVATPRARSLADVATDGTNYLLLWSDDATPLTNAPRLLAATVSGATGAVATPVDVGPGGEAWAERVAGGYLVARYEAATFTTRQLRDTGALVEPAPVARALGAGIAGYVTRVREGSGLGLTWAVGSAAPFALSATTTGPDGSVASAVIRPLAVEGGGNTGSVGVDWDGQQFVAAWDGGGDGAWAARVRRTGARVDARGVEIPFGYPATLAASAGQHLYVRSIRPTPFSLREFSTQRFSPSLTLVGEPLRFTFKSSRPLTFRTAGSPMGYLISTWIDSTGGPTVTLGFVGLDGVVAASTPLFNSRWDYPAHAFAASRTLWTAAWYSQGNNSTSPGPCSIIVNQYDRAGSFATVPLQIPVTCVAPRGSASLAVASDGTDFLVAWTGATGMLALRVRADGTVADPTPITLAPLGGAPRAVWDGRAYTVAWALDGAPISAVRVDASGRVLDAAPVVLVGAGPTGADFALATDGAGVLALGYRRAGAGSVVRGQVRLFSWDTLPSEGDAGATDGGVIVTPTDAGVTDVALADAGATADAGSPDDLGGVPDATIVVDVPVAVDSGVVSTDVPTDRPAPTDLGAPVDVGTTVDAGAAVDAGAPPGDDGGLCDVGGTPGRASGRGVFALLALSLAGLSRRSRRRSGALQPPQDGLLPMRSTR
ncbi:MAG: hypothetical protein Q8S73_04190 [Deltaproteobacteria bacterium]|nr:hypothetical protein [Myxococcales bacterium]MDP3213278.1 hypothetical protein [Deltaproteobacteria bacterium]